MILEETISSGKKRLASEMIILWDIISGWKKITRL